MLLMVIPNIKNSLSLKLPTKTVIVKEIPFFFFFFFFFFFYKDEGDFNRSFKFLHVKTRNFAFRLNEG